MLKLLCSFSSDEEFLHAVQMLIAAMATVEEVEWLSTPVSYSAYITTYF